MPVFMTISKHVPENCPMFSEKHRKSTVELMSKAENLMKKHKIKMLGTWTDFPQHTIYMVLEGTFDAMQKLLMEPIMMGLLSWNTMELKPMLTNEEVVEMLKKAK